MMVIYFAPPLNPREHMESLTPLAKRLDSLLGRNPSYNRVIKLARIFSLESVKGQHFHSLPWRGFSPEGNRAYFQLFYAPKKCYCSKKRK